MSPKAGAPARPPDLPDPVLVPLGELHEDPANARRHGDRNLEAIKASLRAFGQTLPLVVMGDGRVIAGNGRLQAMRALGWTHARVLRVAHWTEQQAAAYALADNRTAELATWDEGALARALAGLPRELRLETGFDAREIADLLSAEQLRQGPDIDEIPAPPDAATSRRGDLWVLGEHRLLCGDSGAAADLDLLLAGAPVHLVNTDPPWNVDVQPRSRVALAAGNGNFPKVPSGKARRREGGAPAGAPPARQRARDRRIANDKMPPEAFDRMLADWFGSMARVLLPGRGFYVWGGYSNVANYPAPLAAAGLYFSQAIIWVKRAPVMNRKDFMTGHEWCFYGWREGSAHEFFGPNNARDVWRERKDDDAALVALPPRDAALHSRDVWEVARGATGSLVHLTEKPVELASRAVLYSSRRGENVLDLFGGSGSTLMACEEADRHAYLLELDPLYCDVIVARWEKFTGGKARLADGGATFAKVASKRRAKPAPAPEASA